MVKHTKPPRYSKEDQTVIGELSRGDADPHNEQELQKMLDAEKAARAKACHDEIKLVLDRHHCELGAYPAISKEGRIVAVIQIVPL